MPGGSPVRRARREFCEALFAVPVPRRGGAPDQSVFRIAELAVPSAAAPVFCMEGAVASELPLLAAMVRESDLGDLAGSLARWEVLESQPCAPFHQRIFYVSKLPWPLRARAFHIGNWVELPGDGSFALLSMSLDPDDAVRARAGKAVWGEVSFSGYHLVPLADGRTWLRRVIGVELHLPMPRAVLGRMLAGVYRANHAWLNRTAQSDAAARFAERMARDPLYAALPA
jgi:hypothetical protein